MKLLSTFKHSDDHCLLFPWAEGGNLKDLWEEYPVPTMDEGWSYWLAEQCAGLADGLSGIHDTRMTLEEIPEALMMGPLPDPQEGSYEEVETNFGRHGDIKPANILWFRNDTNDWNHGMLKITDFGLTTFHREQTTKVLKDKVRGVTQTYMAPEYELNDPVTGQVTHISRKYDIWSLGCLYTEFITWALMGNQALVDFRDERMKERDMRENWELDNFHKIIQHSISQERYAKVKESVLKVSHLTQH